MADSRNKFAAESSQLYNDILAALGKNGPKSESQNMTALAQQSIEIVAKQVSWGGGSLDPPPASSEFSWGSS